MTPFKPLENKDIDTISSLMADFYAIVHYPFTPEVAQKFVKEFVENKNRDRCRLLMQENEAISHLLLRFVYNYEYRAKVAFLDEWYVFRKAKGKEIGKEAVVFAQNQRKILGKQRIYLEVENLNVPAQQLYQKNGFINHPRKLMQFKL
jgi:RimJ/RimL family protein N-acetyltransferase